MPIQKHEFKREEHVYVNSQFSELLKDAVRFFHGTPVLPLPPETPFSGAGVYAIYCIARKGIYKIKITVAAKKGYQKTSKIIYVKVR